MTSKKGLLQKHKQSLKPNSSSLYSSSLRHAQVCTVRADYNVLNAFLKLSASIITNETNKVFSHLLLDRVENQDRMKYRCR